MVSISVAGTITAVGQTAVSVKTSVKMVGSGRASVAVKVTIGVCASVVTIVVGMLCKEVTKRVIVQSGKGVVKGKMVEMGV